MVNNPILHIDTQDLAEGCKVLGVVVRVRPNDATISLPHGLRGRVLAEHVSEPLGGNRHPPLTQLLSVGQLVRATVLPPNASETKGKRVDLSLHVHHMNGGLTLLDLLPGLLLPAAVQQVEDHGYTLHLGIKARVVGNSA